MKTISLQQFVENKTQSEAAQAIGVTPGAIGQMLRSERRIELTINDDGSVQAYEIKPIGRRSAEVA